jgi:hypothetical protein
MCPETLNLSVIAERMHDGTPAHFSRAVRHFLNTDGSVEEDPLHVLQVRHI